MRVFVTGATGFIGSAITRELIAAGHQVLGLTRSDTGAAALAAAGAQAHRGDLNNLESLRQGAAQSDGVIHTAFNHDFSRFVANCEDDRRVIEAIGAVLAGSARPFIITSGTAIANSPPGRPSTENDPRIPSAAFPRAASEEAAAAVATQGVPVMVVRLPQVHDPVKQGLISYVITLAREKGVSAYVGDGQNRWPAAHVLDVARLYRLAFEKREAGAIYNAVAEEGISLRDIAEIIGRGLNIPVVSKSPEEAAAHFGWLGHFIGRDMPSSGAKTQASLGWKPAGPGMVADLKQMFAH